jgi:two-component system, OmpR family, sensor histidine kinase KdpD
MKGGVKLDNKRNYGEIAKAEKNYGKLTIFLGVSTGVGKTNAMLDTAFAEQKEGKKVLIGWLGDYDCYETKLKSENFPTLKPRVISYEDTNFDEMDVEEILNHHPQLVLIENLAHSNTPGSPRSKRFRDVEAILMAGIDVYTTLNVYEIESLKDIASKILSFEVKEAVPDKFLENATEIQFIDCPSYKVIRRFQEGNIRPFPKNIDPQKFFRLGNVMALREMALRYVAGRIDRQLDAYMYANKISGPWPVSEKVMVCVSASPFSRQLIRIARQMATSLKTEWLAVYVATPRWNSKNQQEKLALTGNLQYAEELGANVISTTGSSVSEEILLMARKHNVKQIVIGKPRYSRIREWVHGSVVNEVIRNSHEINVHIIPGQIENHHEKKKLDVKKKKFKWNSYFFITGFVAFLTVLLRFIGLSFDLVNIALFYLFPVLFGSIRWGIGPSFYAAGIGVLAFDFFFVPPLYSFTVADLRYVFSFAVYLIVATLTASLASRLRHQLNEVRQRETITSTLYGLSRQMTAVADLNEALKSIVRQMSDTIGAQVMIYLPSESDELRVTQFSNGHSNWIDSETSRVIAKWVYKNGSIAGKGTQTLRDSSDLYLPIKTEDQVHGVLAINLKNQELVITPDQLQLIEALTSLSAMAIARIKLQEQTKITHLAAESERLRTALLDSISHELRTPLATIIGSVTALIDGDEVFNSSDRSDLLSTIREGAMRMNRLVTNLLGMVRIESGMLRLRKHWSDLEDIVGVALTQVTDSLQNRIIRLEIDDSLPPIEVDDVLIEQVLVNILSNAIKYSPDKSEIVLTAHKNNNNKIEITIKDEGLGIPSNERERIFSKFFRGKSTSNIPGTGLGLAISKGIVEAHWGTIKATENNPKGTIIIISLPLSEPTGFQNVNF